MKKTVTSITTIFSLAFFGCSLKAEDKMINQSTLSCQEKASGGHRGCNPIEVIYKKQDKEIFEEKIEWAKEKNLKQLPYNELIIEIAKSFLGTPYEAYALEVEYPEKLVVNMRGLDCLTFLENALVISKMINENKDSFEDYQSLLSQIRYRNSCTISYSCRLHYYTDWLNDAEQKGILTNITGPDKFIKEINILSKNTKRKNEIPKLQETEKLLSKNNISYFSCSTLEKMNLDKLLQNGDIIGFTSNIKGLDVNHVAFAYKEKNKWTYIDATSVKQKEVEIYPGSIVEYCNRVKTNTGIVLARPQSL